MASLQVNNNATRIFNHSATTVRPPSSSTLQVFHVDFIDTPEFHTRMEEILQGGSIEPISYPTTTTTAAPGGVSTVSISLIIPLCTISFFMMVVGVCLMCHAYYRKRQDVQSRPVTNSYRANVDWQESIRSTAGINSLRSTTGINTRLSNLRSAQGSKLKLDKISEHPVADPGVGRGMMEDDLFSPTDSLISYLSNMRLEMPTVLEGHSSHLSSKSRPSVPAEVSHSFPNLLLSAQAPFSPYRIAWITPSVDPVRAAHSDPYVSRPRGMERRQSVPGNVPVTIPEDVLVNRPAMNYSSSWKSPYHPNHNTPTTGSDGDAAPVPVFANRASADPPPPYSPHDTGSTGTPTTADPVLAMVPERLGTVPARAALVRSASQSTPAILEERMAVMRRHGSVATSCPTELSNWHFNRVYPIPENGEERMLHHPYPPGICHPQYCHVCQMGMLEESASMCPMAGSYGNAAFQQGIGPSTNVSYQDPYSANGSMNVHADSRETSRYDSSGGTTQPGERSGYMAEPSHSTSLGYPSVHSSILRSSNPSTDVIQGLSAIKQGSTNTSVTTGTTDSQQYDSLAATTSSAPAAFASFHQKDDETTVTTEVSTDTGNQGILDPYSTHVSVGSDESPDDFMDTSQTSKTDSSIRSVMLTSFHPPEPGLGDLPEEGLGERLGDRLGDRLGTPGQGSDPATTPFYTPSAPFNWDVYPFPAGTSNAGEVVHEESVDPVGGGDAEAGLASAAGDEEVGEGTPRRRSGQPILMDKRYWV